MRRLANPAVWRMRRAVRQRFLAASLIVKGTMRFEIDHGNACCFRQGTQPGNLKQQFGPQLFRTQRQFPPAKMFAIEVTGGGHRLPRRIAVPVATSARCRQANRHVQHTPRSLK
jgi:hypothetical protein